MKIGLLSLLTVLFVGLKLTDFITWSWLWVLAPLWIYGIAVGLFVVFCVFMAWWTKQI